MFHYLRVDCPVPMYERKLDGYVQWVALRENLQETIGFPMKYGIFHDFPVIFPLNQSIDM